MSAGRLLAYGFFSCIGAMSFGEYAHSAQLGIGVFFLAMALVTVMDEFVEKK